MNFEVEYIEKLAKLISKHSLTEIELKDGNEAITIKKENIVNEIQTVVPQAPIQAPVVQAAEEKVAPPKKEGTPIISPMVGAFYAAPSPGAKPFVKVGDIVSAGQVVCIVEAMKLMNEIETEVSGKITQICVEDGQSVEYGQVLMYVE